MGAMTRWQLAKQSRSSVKYSYLKVCSAVFSQSREQRYGGGGDLINFTNCSKFAFSRYNRTNLSMCVCVCAFVCVGSYCVCVLCVCVWIVCLGVCIVCVLCVLCVCIVSVCIVSVCIVSVCIVCVRHLLFSQG